MARKRQISPSIWTSDQFVALSHGARLLFIGLFSNADDEGRLKASASFLRMTIFPGDACSDKQVSKWLDEVITQGLVRDYSVNGSKYLFLPHWKDHQYVNRIFPSQIPTPPGDTTDSVSNHAPITDISRQSVVGTDVDVGIDTDTGVLAPSQQKAAASEPATTCPKELQDLELYRDNKHRGNLNLWNQWQTFLASAKLAYPGIDILAEVRKAHTWEVANHRKRKVDRIRFLNSWFATAQDHTTKGDGKSEEERF